MAGKQGPETKLVNTMRADAKAKYGERLVIVKNHGSEFAEAGVSDFTGCLDGRYFAIEIKSPESSKHKRATLAASIEHALDKGPTVKQRAFIARVIAADGYGGVAATRRQFLDALTAVECGQPIPDYLARLREFGNAMEDE